MDAKVAVKPYPFHMYRSSTWVVATEDFPIMEQWLEDNNVLWGIKERLLEVIVFSINDNDKQGQMLFALTWL